MDQVIWNMKNTTKVVENILGFSWSHQSQAGWSLCYAINSNIWEKSCVSRKSISLSKTNYNMILSCHKHLNRLGMDFCLLCEYCWYFLCEPFSICNVISLICRGLEEGTFCKDLHIDTFRNTSCLFVTSLKIIPPSYAV